MLNMLRNSILFILLFIFSYGSSFAGNIQTKYINLYNRVYHKIEVKYKFNNNKILNLLEKIENKLIKIKGTEKYNKVNKFKLIVDTLYNKNEEKILEIKLGNSNVSGNIHMQLLNSSKGLLSSGNKLYVNSYKLNDKLLQFLKNIYNDGKTFNSDINSKIKIILEKYKKNLLLQQDLMNSEIKKRNCIENKYTGKSPVYDTNTSTSGNSVDNNPSSTGNSISR